MDENLATGEATSPESPGMPDWDENEFPLGPMGPTAEQIEQMKESSKPSLVYAVMFGDIQDPRPVIVRTIQRSEFNKLRSESATQDDFEEKVIQEYVLWPRMEILREWTETFAGIPTTISEAIFQYSGFMANIQGVRL